MKKALTVVTRGSKLALWQADFVTGQLEARGAKLGRLVVKTEADRVQDRFLHEMGGKGLFIKELEQALLDGRADLAVHSLKDMPAATPGPFELAAVLKRHRPTDLLIVRKDVAAKAPLPAPGSLFGARDAARLGELTIGTGSLRRQAILKSAAPALKAVGIRGNVDTRLAKLEAGNWDAIILAEASIERLGITDLAAWRLDPDWFIPSSSQGALAVETRKGDEIAGWIREALGCETTTRAVGIERGLLAALGGDCNLPFGCHAAPGDGGRFTARAAVWDREGRHATTMHTAVVASAGDEAAFIDAMAEGLRKAGVAGVLQALGLDVPARFT